MPVLRREGSSSLLAWRLVIALSPFPVSALESEATPGVRLALWVPVQPITLPRTTARSWWIRSRRYMGWRDAVRFHIRLEAKRLCPGFSWPGPLEVRSGSGWVVTPARLWVGISPEALRNTADLSNLQKALEDVLVGQALPDDSLRFLWDSRGSVVPRLDPGGFAFVLEALPDWATSGGL